MIIALPAAVVAQGLDCNRLRAAIRASESDAGPSDTGSFERAARQQRYEMDRTRSYADQIGCSQIGFFNDPPPECGDLENRLQRMQDNLDRMQARADDAPRPDRAGQQAALIARYNATCVGAGPGNPADLGQQQAYGFDPNQGRNPSDLRTLPMDPDALSTVPLDGDIMDDSGGPARNAGKAICVRTCDGGYFPIAPRATQDQLGGLEDLCKASCPNTEARLYTMGSSGDLASATSVDGSSYTALPAAFKFEKTFTASCTCKPPNQTWVQALAGAEKLLASADRRDVTVTASMSDQMAKPAAAAQDPLKGKSARSKGKAAAAPTPDHSAAADGLRAAQAPTATNDSAGIGGPVQSSKVVRAGDGPTIAVNGPDGVKKRVRLIVP